jgi:hypothetical protein
MTSTPGFIQLDRTFRDLTKIVGDSDSVDLASAFSFRGGTTWLQLLGEHRIVILSEAGSGKTEEIRNAARALRDEGRQAFFLRLEHVKDDFESAFEEGNCEEFEDWVSSGVEGWARRSSSAT